MPFRTIQIDIDDAVFQIALNRATREGKAIGQLVAEFLKENAAQATPVPVSAPTPTPTIAAPAQTTYTVQRGDTLARIAQKVYGDARKYPEIQRANNLADAGRIFVGQVLIVPSLAGAGPVAVTDGTANDAAQHVSTSLVGGQDTVDHQKGAGADVVGNHPE